MHPSYFDVNSMRVWWAVNVPKNCIGANCMKPELSDPSLLRTTSYVAGRWMAAAGSCLTVTNPATGGTVAEVSMVTRSETEAAISAAHEAMRGWRATPAKARAQVLRRWFDLMMAHQEDLAIIMTTEQGKALACLLYTSPSPRDATLSRMPSSA